MSEIKVELLFKPIGLIYSEHTVSEKTPIQSVFAKDCLGRVEVFPEFEEGLKDIEGFSHLYLIYYFHKSESSKLIVKPFLKDNQHGVFATRAPCHPNPIGLSIVELIERKKNILYLKGVDILNKTPLIDIKPYISRFDNIKTSSNGWQDNVNEKNASIKGLREYKK